MTDTDWHTTLLGAGAVSDGRATILTNFGNARKVTVLHVTTTPVTLAEDADFVTVDTGVGVVTVNLPASPVVGDSYRFARTAGASNLIIGRNGNNIDGAAADVTVSTSWEIHTLVWSADASSWIHHT